jgi:hypothetical protein
MKIFTIFLLVILIAGCSSMLPSGGGYSSSYSSNLGTAFRTEIVDWVPRVLELQGYQINQSRIEHNDIRYITNWQNRPIYTDEIANGVLAARIRITVEGRIRGHASFGYMDEERYSLSLLVENSFKMDESDEWVAFQIGAPLQQYIKELEDELKRVLEIRI